jgi:sugar phosphate isomerase/epimerase
MQPAVSRRSLLAGLAAMSAAACAGPQAGGSPKPFFGLGGESLGLQIYTLGDEGQADLGATFEAVRAIGYRTVELISWGPNSAAETKAALDRSGLTARSTQANFRGPANLNDNLDKLIADANLLGLKYIAASIPEFPTAKYGGPLPGEATEAFIARLFARMDAGDWTAYADKLNRIGAKLQEHGLAMVHHNHNVDFNRVGDRTGYDIIQQNTDPALVFFELDVGWVKAAGLDPVALLERYSGRYRMMHVKDIKATTIPNFSLKQDPAILGEGIMDWSKILPAAKSAGITDYYVEQEPPFTMPRMEAVRKNFEYLSTLKV